MFCSNTIARILPQETKLVGIPSKLCLDCRAVTGWAVDCDFRLIASLRGGRRCGIVCTQLSSQARYLCRPENLRSRLKAASAIACRAHGDAFEDRAGALGEVGKLPISTRIKIYREFDTVNRQERTVS